jgi:hypothetical protein
MSPVTFDAAVDLRGRPFAGVLLRELQGYLITPVAWLFTVIFLVFAGAFTFYLGAFFERGRLEDVFWRVSSDIEGVPRAA